MIVANLMVIIIFTLQLVFNDSSSSMFQLAFPPASTQYIEFPLNTIKIST